MFELALANRRFGAETVQELMAGASFGRSAEPMPPLSQAQEALVARVAFAVTRVGAYLPWRSDCMVQALAAQRWLTRSAIASEICIGVRKPDKAGMDAHAWLKVGDRIVTGGDISGFAPLRAANRGEPPQACAGPSQEA